MYHMIYRVRECIVRLEIANPIFVRLHVGGEGRGAGFAGLYYVPNPTGLLWGAAAAAGRASPGDREPRTYSDTTLTALRALRSEQEPCCRRVS